MLIKKLLSNITGENFRRGKVTKCFPSDEYFSPTKFSPISYVGDSVEVLSVLAIIAQSGMK